MSAPAPVEDQQSTDYTPPYEQGDYIDYVKQKEAQAEIDNLNNAYYNTPAVTNEERLANSTTQTQSSGIRQKFQGAFRGWKKKSPIVVIITLMAGSGSAFLITLAPGTPLLMLADKLDKDLNTQLSAVDKTTNQLWRTKLKKVTPASCGLVALCKKFSTVNMNATEKVIDRNNASKPDKLKIEYDKDAGWGEGRGRPTTFTVTKADGTKLVASNPDEFAKLMKTEALFRDKMYMVYSPRFSVYKGKAAVDFMTKNKVSYALAGKGDTEEEVRKNMDDRVKATADIEVKKLTAVTDDDGKPTGEYTDPDTGRVYSQAEYDGLLQQEEKIKVSPSTSSTLGKLAVGASFLGGVDTACSANTIATAVRVGARTIQYSEMIRFAFVRVIQPAHAIRANMANPALVEATSKDIMETAPAIEVPDESKIDSTPSGQDLPMIRAPNAGKNATDAAFVKVADQDYGATKNLSLRSKALVVGGDKLSKIGNVQNAIARLTGASSPREVAQRCKVVQNVFVRSGVLAISLAAGLGSFGLTTAISMAGSVALAMALPYLTSQLADMAAGRVTEGLRYDDFGNGAAIGADATYNGVARRQGLMSMSPDKMTEYQNTKREVLQAYDDIDRLAAKQDPFDVTNQFSFLGSLARTTVPITASLQSSTLAGLASSIPLVASAATSSLLPFASADDNSKYIVQKDRYTYCNDPDYAELGPNVAINPTCVMVFGLPKEAMAIDPMENLNWMIANNEIIADSDSGDPADNGADWNYMKFIEQCVDQQPGATEDIEKDPTNGSGCVAEANYEKNWHYAKFKLSLGINEGLDQDLPGMDGGSEEGFATGENGGVGEDGWAYPTDKTKTTVSSGFGMRGGTRHNGTDLAGPLDTNIYAARDGTVVDAGPASGFGNWIVIRHDYNGKRVDTVYGHMASSGVLVKKGQEVKAGDHIGKIGNEGQSTGPHLHFEVWENGGYKNIGGGTGEAVNPQRYLDMGTKTGSAG